jgi:hypothetical protein
MCELRTRDKTRVFCFDVWDGSHTLREGSTIDVEPDIPPSGHVPQQSRPAPARRLCFCLITTGHRRVPLLNAISFDLIARLQNAKVSRLQDARGHPRQETLYLCT